jgi:hypothetical protein
VWTESLVLYYIKKEFIDQIIKLKGLELVWYQFIAKYGEFGKHKDLTLNPSFKDLKELFLYSSFTKK